MNVEDGDGTGVNVTSDSQKNGTPHTTLPLRKNT